MRLSVEYRVHSRQMLCVGGSQIPFGWSFLSIAKVPASWNPGDMWAVEVELPAGTKVEYKYVILEEQDWTQQVSVRGRQAHPPPPLRLCSGCVVLNRWRRRTAMQRSGQGFAGCEP